MRDEEGFPEKRDVTCKGLWSERQQYTQGHFPRVRAAGCAQEGDGIRCQKSRRGPVLVKTTLLANT